eukprot:gene10859-12014_t
MDAARGIDDKAKSLIAGSRNSKLAMIQTDSVVEALKQLWPDLKCPIVTMSTLGDKVLDKALPKIGEKSLFTKDLEIALAEKRVDFLVHSLKDLPTTLPEGMAIGAICKRDNPCDAVLFHPKHGKMTLADLPNGSVVGTSSLRRIAQLKRKYAHLNFENVRGNLNTRLKKLEDDNKYDALILAAAGVRRMNWSDKIGQVLLKEDCLYAVGQGALAVEVKTDDVDSFPVYASLNDEETFLCCVAERSFLKVLGGGCSTPVGVWSNYNKENSELELTGAVLSLDGSTCIKHTISGSVKAVTGEHNDRYVVTKSQVIVNEAFESSVHDAEDIGRKLADALKEQGANDVLTSAQKQIAKTQNDLRTPSQASNA